MTSFFLKQPTHSGSVSSSRRNSISSVEGPISGTGSRAASVDTEQKPSDYQKTFQPFFRKEYTTLAPPSKLSFIPESLAFARQQAELCFAREASSDAYPKLKQSNVFTRSRKWGHGKQQSVRNLVSQIQSSDSNTIDLTQEDPLRLLKNVPLKFLKYAEDVRPPYVGTYTKTPVDCSVATLCRNPFKRALPLVAYDYDSEVEWEEPEEGEDLDSEGEEELDEEDVDDMDGFLDDDDVEGPKRRHIMGDIEPVSTGIRWVENTNEKEQVVPFGKSTLDLTTLRVESLLRMWFGP